MSDNPQEQRLILAGVILSDQAKQNYFNAPDTLEIPEKGEIPEGYKRCGGCKKVHKLYLFNLNNQSKNKCTGNCKKCQKEAASRSYLKNGGKRDYKDYYAKNKETKLANNKRYYEENKEVMGQKHKEYLQTKKGRNVMRKAHTKRRKTLADHKGIPYTRELVIARDTLGNYPVCYLCGEEITVSTNLHLDHVVPVALKGPDCFSNVACTHQLCNLRKEKDARKLSAKVVEEIIKRSEAYINAHPELFDTTT